MIIDSRSEFAARYPAPTGGAGTFNFGNAINLQQNGDDLPGGPLVVVRCVETITGGAGAKLAMQLASDGQGAVATDGSQTIHGTGKAFATPIAAGAVLFAGRLPTHPPYEQYLGLQAVVTVAALTGGKIAAQIVSDCIGWAATPDAL